MLLAVNNIFIQIQIFHIELSVINNTEQGNLTFIMFRITPYTFYKSDEQRAFSRSKPLFNIKQTFVY